MTVAAETDVYRALFERRQATLRGTEPAWLSGLRQEAMERFEAMGFPTTRDGRVNEGEGRMGLTGMRERMLAVGGTVELRNSAKGAEVTLRLPVMTEAAA